MRYQNTKTTRNTQKNWKSLFYPCCRRGVFDVVIRLV